MGFWKKLAEKCFELDDKNNVKSNVPSDDKEEMAERHAATIREINEKLSKQISEIEQIESKLRDLLKCYDKASVAAKKTYKVQILSLKEELDGLQEIRDIYERNLAKEKLILRKIRLHQETASIPDDIDEIQKLEDETIDQIVGLEQEDRFIDDLSKVKYRNKRKEKVKQTENESESVSPNDYQTNNESDFDIESLRAALKSDTDAIKENSEIENLKEQLEQ